jgi:hypothetical protein
MSALPTDFTLATPSVAVPVTTAPKIIATTCSGKSGTGNKCNRKVTLIGDYCWQHVLQNTTIMSTEVKTQNNSETYLNNGSTYELGTVFDKSLSIKSSNTVVTGELLNSENCFKTIFTTGCFSLILPIGDYGEVVNKKLEFKEVKTYTLQEVLEKVLIVYSKTLTEKEIDDYLDIWMGMEEVDSKVQEYNDLQDFCEELKADIDSGDVIRIHDLHAKNNYIKKIVKNENDPAVDNSYVLVLNQN